MEHRPVLPLAIIIALCALGHIGCGKKQDANTAQTIAQLQQQPAAMTTGNEAQQTPQIVCVFDGTPVREGPNKKGKFVSSMSLGESVKDLGGTATDAADNNREYFNVELSDGKTGWAPSFGLVRNAVAGAIKEPAIIFKRPDMLTMTKDKFEPMEMVAIGQSKDEWAEVIGEAKKKQGWIKKEFITTAKEDIAVAVFALKKMREQSAATAMDRTMDIIANAPFPESYFVQRLKQQMQASMDSSASTPVAMPVAKASDTVAMPQSVAPDTSAPKQ